jgi:hypothetical protein
MMIVMIGDHLLVWPGWNSTGMLTVRHLIVLDVPKMILVIQDLMTRLLKDPLWMPEPLEMILLVGLILGVHVVVVTGLL